MFCPNCGTRNDDDARFCAECGALLNVQQGGSAAPDIGMSWNTQTVAGKPKKGKKALIGVAVAAVVAAAAVTAVMLVGKPKEESAETDDRIAEHMAQQVFYFKDDSLYFTKLDKIDPVEVKEDVISGTYTNINGNSYLSLLALYSADRRSLFFIGKDGLYRYDIKSDECERLESNVSGGLGLSADGNVIYEKNDTLYIHDGKDKEKFQKGIDNWTVSGDGTKVRWEDDDGRTYVSDAKVGAEKIKIDTDIDGFCYESDNFDCLLYYKDYALYIMSGLDEKEKLTSYFSGFYDHSDNYVPVVDVVGEGKNLKIVYSEESNPNVAYREENVTEEAEEPDYYSDKEKIGDYTYWDFIDDDMAASDAGISEPKESDYQSEGKYQSFYGTETYTETDYDAYYAAWDEYDEKCMRDSLREELKSRYYHGESEESLRTVRIYDVATKETVVVCEDSTSSRFAAQDIDGDAVVEGYYGKHGDYPKIKLSQIWGMAEDYDSMEEIYDNLGGIFYKSLGDRPHEWSFYIYCNGSVYYPFGEDMGDFEVSDVIEDMDSGKLYALVTESDDDESSLVQLFTSGGKAGTYTVLYDGVHEILEAQDGSVYYSKDYDSDSETYDLYCDGEKVSYDVCSSVLADDGTLIFGTDGDYYDAPNSRYRTQGSISTLSVAGKDSNTKISDDVYLYYYAGDGKFILLRDMNEKGEGDLYYYDGKELNRISTDVQSFLIR